jgi:hypothetical protein
MFHPVKLGLDNMRKLHQLLGNPMDDVRKVMAFDGNIVRSPHLARFSSPFAYLFTAR